MPDRASETSERRLSSALLEVLSTTFFSPLARQATASVFIDCIDRLERESAASAGELDRQETLQLISESLSTHREIDWSQESESALTDVRAYVNYVFNRLLAAGWLSERDLGIDDRRILVEPTIRWLLDAFRKMSSVGRAEVHSFADTLRAVCDEFLVPDHFDPARRPADEMYARLGDLVRRAETATHQLSHVYLILRGFIEKQGKAASGSENLRIFFDDFGAGGHQVCYDELFAKGLLHRLGEAQKVVESLRWDYSVKQHLAQGLAQRHKVEEAEAREKVNTLLDHLDLTLGSIGAMARQIDGRVSHFHKVSIERFSYLNDRSGQNVDLMKRVFELIDGSGAGASLGRLPDLGLPLPRVPEVEAYHGNESLRFPVQRRSEVRMPGRLRALQADDGEAIEQLRKRYNESLSPIRAARFVRRQLPEPGLRRSSHELKIHNEDDLFDLLSVVVHSRYAGLQWRVLPNARQCPWHPEKTLVDTHCGFHFERFIIHRIH